MKFKKLFAMFVSVVLVFSLASCGNNNRTASVATEDNDDFYTIEWYYINADVSQKDVTPIQNRLNEYLKDKINAEVHMNVFDWGTYDERTNLMLQSKEKMDLCYTYGSNYYTRVSKGAFLAIDDLLPKYAPKLYKEIDGVLLDGAKVNGKNYGVPALKEYAHSTGFIYRSDIVDKLGIDMDSVKSFEDIIPVLDKVKEAYPDIHGLAFGGSGTPVDAMDFDAAYLGYGMFFENYDGKIINLYETDKYKEACNLAYKLKSTGYTFSETGKTQDDLVNSGVVFAALYPYKPGKVEEVTHSKKEGLEFKQNSLHGPRTYTQDCSGSMMAIPATCENPARVMKFLELLNTDEYVNNLVNFGIENENYTKNDDGTIHILAGSKYNGVGYQWMMGNNFINYIVDNEEKDKHEKLKKYNEETQRSKMLGFAFDAEPVRNEATAVANVISEYQDQLRYGMVSVDDKYDEFINKMKKAGSDKVLKEVQRQYDEWAKANKE